jgi:hypothetical protein
MNLAILLPVALLVVIVLVVYYSRRSKSGGSGLGERPDETERPELRGSEQWKKREP